MRARSWRLGLLVLLLVTAPARAAIYDWSYSDPNRSGSGTLTVSGGASPFTITDISGSFAGNSILQLLSPGECCGAPGADNLFFSPGPFLSGNGMAFVADGPNFYNILFLNGAYATQDGTGVFTNNGTFTATLAAVGEVPIPMPIPEPGSLGLLALGLVGLAGAAGARRRAGA
jgi:hypothetical protein